MKKTICLILSVGLLGCVSQSKILMNAHGQTTYCTHKGWGWLGAPMALAEHEKCVKAAKAAGYSDAPAAGPSYNPLSDRLDCATSEALAKTDPAFADPACKKP